MATKIQRLKDWLCGLLGCGQVEETAPTPIKGTNIERWRFDGYDIEAEIYSDRVRISVYLKGGLYLRTWAFSNPDEKVTYDNNLNLYPNHKLRNRLREYIATKLEQLRQQNKV